MRKIKFRAYAPELNKIVDVFAVNPMNKTVYLSHYQLFGTEGEDVLVSYAESKDEFDKPVELIQYTGLKDKNGVEVYEGDVITIVDKASDWTEKTSREKFSQFIVEWSETLAGWYPKSLNGYEPDETWWQTWEVEVIGDIYQNPELIEGGDRE